MRALSVFVGGKANSGGDARVGKSSAPVGSFERLRNKFRALFPVKTAYEVAARAHISPRSAERFLNGDGTLSTEALIHLLRSDNGLHFLVALMDRARPAWWSNLLRLGALGGIERRRAADLALLRSITNADRPLAAELPPAMLVQDEDFYQPFLEGLASAAASGASGGAVGSREGGR